MFVRVSLPAFVATVESIARVTFVPEAVDVIPVPPNRPSVSVPSTISIADEPSDISKSCATTCEFT